MDILEETELRATTQELYDRGGADNVLACVQEMMRVERVILTKLHEILLKERKYRAI